MAKYHDYIWSLGGAFRLNNVESIPVFVINLNRRKDRMAAMEKRLCGVDFERIEAVDGDQLKGERWQDLLADEPAYPLAVREVACLCSHRLAIQRIIDRQLPFACVLEDDVVLSPDFSSFLNDYSWLPDEFGVIKIETVNKPVWMKRQGISAKGRDLKELCSCHYGAGGYIVSKKGAEKLFQRLLSPDRPMDDLIFDFSFASRSLGPILQLLPALCIQECILTDDMSLSDLEESRNEVRAFIRKKPKGLAKLWREVKRPCEQLQEKWRYIDETHCVVAFD